MVSKHSGCAEDMPTVVVMRFAALLAALADRLFCAQMVELVTYFPPN